MQIFKKNKSRFRIVIHDLETKKTKTISLLANGDEDVNTIYKKAKECLEKK